MQENDSHQWSTTSDGERVECRWCLVSPLSDDAQDLCPEGSYREASDRLRASRLAQVHVVREDDVELDRMAEDFGHNNKEEI